MIILTRQATTGNDGSEWLYVPKGTGEKLPVA
jgi:hypothetical protein